VYSLSAVENKAKKSESASLKDLLAFICNKRGECVKVKESSAKLQFVILRLVARRG